jgi:N-dimethylarginine dimethylaminohydrolase
MTSVLDIPGAAAGRRVPDRRPTARHYLMCPPVHFAVDYAINPWMDPSRPVDVPEAMRQWSALRETYLGLGHRVEQIDPEPGLPDMVFAANSGTVIGGVVLGARFRSPHRAAEAEHYRRWFHAVGYRTVVMPERVNEAEGDLAWTGRELLAGHGFRTDRAAHDEAGRVLGVPTVSLRLVDPRFYHLDTALTVLHGDPAAPLVAYLPEAFAPGSRRTLRRLFPDAVIADQADALCLGLNAVSDGRHVVLAREATGLAGRVAALGFEPVPVEVGELRKSGGGPKCVTMELRG